MEQERDKIRHIETISLHSQKPATSVLRSGAYTARVPSNTLCALLYFAEHPRLRDVGHVDEDVVRGMTVQRRAQALLVEVVADESDAAPEDEQTVERADLR